MTTPAGRHRDFAASFQHVVDETTDWDAPSPVKEWSARDIVDHLLDWLPPVLSAWAAVDLPDAQGDSPSQRWAHRVAAVQALLDDPDLSGRPVQDGPFDGQPLALVIDRIYTADIYMHTWDLARANHTPVTLDPAYAREALDGMRPIENILRESGQYGAPVPTDSADPVDQLMAFIGRHP